MLENVLVRQCMTYPVITVTPNMSIRLAQCAMHDNHIRHLPVLQGDLLVGILSSGDIRRAMPSNATSLSIWEIHALWDRVTVEEAMTSYLVTVNPNTTILEAIRLLYEYRFNSLPVVDDQGQLLGILTEVDVFRVLLQENDRSSSDLAISSRECEAYSP